MKKLIIVRHGEYQDWVSGYPLSEDGKRQIRGLVNGIREHVNDGKALILFSTRTRAVQSAEILSSELRIASEAHEVLVSGGGELNLAAALSFVQQQKDRADVVILVTHLEYGEMFPSHFAKHELGLQDTKAFNGYGIKKGHAWVIDCEARTMALLSPVA